MANEIYSKSWWGAGACENNVYWGYIYHSYACGNDNSFFGRFGTPESAYSLRNLTNDPNQFVARISNGEEEFDIKQNEILKFLEYETIRVVKWYDQAGTEQDLLADNFFSAPYLIKDGKLQTENEKPTLQFASDCYLLHQERIRPELGDFRGYLTASFNESQEIGIDGNRIITDIQKTPMNLLQWAGFNSLKSLVYSDINQNNIGPTFPNKGLFEFSSDYTILALYNIASAMRTPYNFLLGQNTDMNVSEFILYDSKDRNVQDVTENIIEDYKIKIKPVKPIGDAPIGIPKK